MQSHSTAPDLFGELPTHKCVRCGQRKPQHEFPLCGERRARNCEACRTLTEKPCTDCKTVHPIEDFCWQNKKGSLSRRRGSICKSCRARRCREWNAKHSKTKLLNGNLVNAYGITLDDYNAMLAAQGGLCAICGKPPENTNQRNWRLNVDHCHDCGGVRKLLCATCNNGLGCFKDDLKLLEKAIGYLQSHTHSG